MKLFMLVCLSTIAFGLSVSLVSAFGAFVVQSEKITFCPSKKKACYFNFPKDFTLGQIIIAEGPGESKKALSGAARGRIAVPTGKYVTFVPSRRFYEKPDLINILPPIGIDCLEMTASSMDDAEDGMCDRALARIGRLKSVIRLNLDRSDASDQGAAFARQLPALQEISAFATIIEGACFADFAHLKNLKVLMLHGSPIKEENLRHLSAISSLRALSLSSTGLTDSGMHYLADCKQLTCLDIGANRRISDKSVDSLTELKNLRSVVLSGTSISYNGVIRMKGIPLEKLRLPGQGYTSAQLKTLHKAFPKAELFANDTGMRSVSPETKMMYAPLH